MARKKSGKKCGEAEKGYTYDLDVVKRLEILGQERKRLDNEAVFFENRLVREEGEQDRAAIQARLCSIRAKLCEVTERMAHFSVQTRILECDDKPVDVHLLDKRALEDELKHSYCAKCTSPDLKITKIFKIECRTCGRKRLITVRLDESKK